MGDGVEGATCRRLRAELCRPRAPPGAPAPHPPAPPGPAAVGLHAEPVTLPGNERGGPESRTRPHHLSRFPSPITHHLARLIPPSPRTRRRTSPPPPAPPRTRRRTCGRPSPP